MSKKSKKTKVVIQSMTDLITNSSTIIYTISDNSPKALIPLVDEFFKIAGMKLKCKDVFDISVQKDMDAFWDYCKDQVDESNEDIPKELRCRDWNKAAKAWYKFQKDLESGKIQKPKWFKELEKEVNDQLGDSSGDTTLVIVPKDPKYKKLATLLINFLYSTDAQESYDG
jgi:hypothetical protein